MNMVKMMNNPLGEVNNLINDAKEGMTEMVANAMPENYYD